MKIFSLFILLFFGIQFQGFGQLTSVDVSVSMVSMNVGSGDSLQHGSVLEVQVMVNDISSLGEVIIDVLDASSGNPLSKYSYTASQIASLGMFTDGKIQIHTGLINPSGAYIIKTSVSNLQLANLPQVITTFPNN